MTINCLALDLALATGAAPASFLTFYGATISSRGIFGIDNVRFIAAPSAMAASPAVFVPEPEFLAMLGLGLFGIAATCSETFKQIQSLRTRL